MHAGYTFKIKLMDKVTNWVKWIKEGLLAL